MEQYSMASGTVIFLNGVSSCGKYAQRYAAGSNIVRLDPDVAEIFPDSDSVNKALRTLIKISRQTTKKAPQQPINEATQEGDAD
jgi:hypothetical protein